MILKCKITGMDHLKKASLIRAIDIYHIASSVNDEMQAIKQISQVIDQLLILERKSCRNVCDTVANDFRGTHDLFTSSYEELEEIKARRETLAKVADLCANRIYKE